MAAKSESLRFDITAETSAAEQGFKRFGHSVADITLKMDDATAKAIYLDDALKRQAETARRSADATLALAKSDEILAEVERRTADGALEEEFALKRAAEAKKKDAAASRKAADENKGLAASMTKLADSMKKGGGPAWLGPALALAPVATSLLGVGAGATIGIAGAAAAGAGALAAFGAVAKPVLSQALTAEQAVQSAQDAYNVAIAHGTKQAVAYKAEQIAIGKAYAEMSPQQIALSKQLGAMGNAWQNLKAQETPVVAGALQPWLKSVTDLTGKLPTVISAVSPVIRALGTDFDHLVNSSAFTGFRNFVAGTGSFAVGAAGATLTDFVKSFLILLPKFNPLIDKMIQGIGDLGPAVLKWSSSKKASDDITKFMGWFSKNGPAVGGLLKNIGGALKALAPGLGPASAAELNVFSQFFGFIAKLPPWIAKPLLEVAGVMLTLNKLGVVSVGVKLLGLGGAGGGAAAAGEAAAGGAAAATWRKLLPGVAIRMVAGAAVAVVALRIVGSFVPANKNPQVQADEKNQPGIVVKADNLLHLTHMAEWIDKNFSHPIRAWFENSLPNFFKSGNHTVAHIWDLTWHNTVDRLSNGLNDTDRLMRGWEHDVAHWFDTARHDTAAIWDSVWRNTAGRAASGVSAVMHWIGTLPGRIVALFANAGTWLYNAGRGLVSGLVSGVESLGGSVASAITSLIPSPLRAAWHNLTGFASGTSSAPPGWAWVGEHGPELMRFHGGEQVMPAGASAAMAQGRGGDSYYITVNVPPTVNPKEAGRQVAEIILAHTRGGGRLYPAGVTPR